MLMNILLNRFIFFLVSILFLFVFVFAKLCTDARLWILTFLLLVHQEFLRCLKLHHRSLFIFNIIFLTIEQERHTRADVLTETLEKIYMSKLLYAENEMKSPFGWGATTQTASRHMVLGSTRVCVLLLLTRMSFSSVSLCQCRVTGQSKHFNSHLFFLVVFPRNQTGSPYARNTPISLLKVHKEGV